MTDHRSDQIPALPSVVIEPDGDNLFSVTVVHADGRRETVVNGYRMFDAQQAAKTAEDYQRHLYARAVKARNAARGGNDA